MGDGRIAITQGTAAVLGQGHGAGEAGIDVAKGIRGLEHRLGRKRAAAGGCGRRLGSESQFGGAYAHRAAGAVGHGALAGDHLRAVGTDGEIGRAVAVHTQDESLAFSQASGAVVVGADGVGLAGVALHAFGEAGESDGVGASAVSAGNRGCTDVAAREPPGDFAEVARAGGGQHDLAQGGGQAVASGGGAVDDSEIKHVDSFADGIDRGAQGHRFGHDCCCGHGGVA